MEPGILRLGVWQDSGTPGDVEANLSVAETAAGEAAAQKVDLLVFPECFLTGYYRPDGVPEIAATVDDGVVDRLLQISSSSGVALVVGTYEQSGDAVYNTAMFVSPADTDIIRYRKRALYGDWENAQFAPGDDTAVFEFKGIRTGILICFDVEFPELARELALDGVQLLLVPTALMAPYDKVARLMVPTRAMENQFFVAYANRIGAELDLRYVGLSRICSPTGGLMAGASDHHAEMITADIDVRLIAKVRHEFPYLEGLARLGRSSET